MSNSIAFNPFTGAPQGWPQATVPPADYQSDLELNSKYSVLPTFDEAYGEYNSFTGADIVAYIHIPSQEDTANQAGASQQTSPIIGILGNIQTISYSTFREVNPVRSLGKVYPDSYTRGPRTIAGTIIWTVMDQYVLAQALKYSSPDSIYSATSMLIDQIPPFNIIITMSNEYGDAASMGLYGIRIVNEGSTYSIDDMITEQTNTFVAADIDLLHKGAPFKNNSSMPAQKSGSSVLMNAIANPLDNSGSDE